jgi:hypothetical protein
MAKRTPKDEIITFKVDGSLLEAMKGVPNRSQFIRHAILVALDSVCPVCKGTGSLTPNQREHWKAFSTDHALEECGECHEVRLVCRRKPRAGARAHRSPPVHRK